MNRVDPKKKEKRKCICGKVFETYRSNFRLYHNMACYRKNYKRGLRDSL